MGGLISDMSSALLEATELDPRYAATSTTTLPTTSCP
jgi:hypothetical protein